MTVITEKDVVLPKRRSDSHKGENGRVLVIGGSEEFVGAVALAGVAALRTGADTVVVFSPEKVGWAINSLSADLMVRKAKGMHFSPAHLNQALLLAKKADVVLLGNGLGLRKETQQFVQLFVSQVKKPLVLDADALKAVKLQDVHGSLLTPHQRELEILAGHSFGAMRMSRRAALHKLASLLRDNVLLVKGKEDVVVSTTRILTNRTGNPGMSKGGTGDVLAGMCAGFVAQGLSLEQSAVNGCFLNGVMGDRLLQKKKWYSYLASDLLHEIRALPKKTKARSSSPQKAPKKNG